MKTELELIHEAAMKATRTSDEPIKRGTARELMTQRAKERASTKVRVNARFDADIVAKYKEIAGDEGSYQSLMNQALREWLDRKELRNVIREELERERMMKALTTATATATATTIAGRVVRYRKVAAKELPQAEPNEQLAAFLTTPTSRFSNDG